MANIDEAIGLPNSHPAIEYRPNPNGSFGPPGSTGGGGGSAGAGFGYPRSVLKQFGLHIGRPRALYFHRRDRVRRSAGGRIVRTDPKSIPNTRVGEGRQAGLGAATIFRPSPGG